MNILSIDVLSIRNTKPKPLFDQYDCHGDLAVIDSLEGDVNCNLGGVFHEFSFKCHLNLYGDNKALIFTDIDINEFKVIGSCPDVVEVVIKSYVVNELLNKKNPFGDLS